MSLRQRLHGTGSAWNRYEIGTDKPCVYTGPVESGKYRICYLVPNGSTCEGDPIWNCTVPVLNRSRVNRAVRTTVDPIPKGSEHIGSRVNVALRYKCEKMTHRLGWLGWLANWPNGKQLVRNDNPRHNLNFWKFWESYLCSKIDILNACRRLRDSTDIQ